MKASNTMDAKKYYDVLEESIKDKTLLINSYEKEEYFLKDKLKNIETVERLEAELEKVSELEKNKFLDKKYRIKKENVDLSIELLNSYQKEEYILKDYLELMKKYEILEKRYNALNSSKLGRLTKFIWEKKRAWRSK